MKFAEIYKDIDNSERYMGEFVLNYLSAQF